MHDMVRDFAISIASESKRGIWARIDFGRSEWSNDLNCNETTIALHNSFHQIPAQIDCPKLNLLVLEKFYGGSSTVLPAMFFEGMTELRVLSIVRMDILTVPIALIQSLVNLQTLCLDGCSIKALPSIITELKCLEILSLSRCKITELPREIEQLTRLRILDLSNCTILIRIPAGVLSRLSQLEGLYMGKCAFKKWGEDDSASLDELKALSYLSDLNMDFLLDNAEHFPQDIQLPRLSEFQFNLGEYGINGSEVKECFPKTLAVYGTDGKRIASHQGFKMLLNKAEYLILEAMQDVECFLSDIKREGFSTLKRLDIWSDSTVEYLANTTTTTTKEGVMILRHKVFPVLETLQLQYMSKLKEICHGQLPAGSFCELRQLMFYQLDSLEDLWVVGNNNASLPNLTRVSVSWCPKLKKLINICSQNIANGFGQQLHEISVENCLNLEEIFTYVDVGVEEETNEILLPKLKILNLKRQPNLTTFCNKGSTRGILQQTFFPEKILYLNLEDLSISGNFDDIGWSTQISGNNFLRLKKVSIDNCHNLRRSFPSNLVQRWSNLEGLYICECNMMKVIIVDNSRDLLGEEAEEADDKKKSKSKSKIIVFPKLTTLELSQMRELTCFYNGNYTLEFPSLSKLVISYCPKMETIVFGSSSDNEGTKRKNNYNTGTSSTSAAVKLVEDNSDAMMMKQSLFNDQIVFSNLNKLVVSGSFEEIWPPRIPGNSFCRLTDLEIYDCDKLKIAIPFNMVQRLQSNLKRLIIRACKMMKDLVSNTELEGADQEEGNPDDMQKLTNSYRGSSVLEFPSLEELSIENCPKLEAFFAKTAEGNPDDMAQVLFNEKITFSKLKTLKVGGIFEHIWSPQDQLLLAENNFRVLRVLIIDGCHRLKKAIPSILAKCLYVLEELKVKNCDLVEEVIVEEVLGESVHGEENLFPRLTKVSLVALPKLTHVRWKDSFSHTIECLAVDNCGALGFLFSYSQVKYFNKLKELEISSCEIMKEIVGEESIAEEHQEDRSADKKNKIIFQEDHGHYIVEFPSLSELRIVNCPKMKTVASDGDSMVQSLFNEKVLLPALVTLEIVGLKCVKEIWCKQFPAKGLSSVQWIYIRECLTLEEVLVAKEEEQRLVQVSDHVQDKVIVFPHLLSFHIESLPNLRSFYSGSLTLKFPSLDYFNFGDCPKMQTFSPGLVVTPKLHSVYKSDGPDAYDWKGDLNNTIQNVFQEKEIQSRREKYKASAES